MASVWARMRNWGGWRPQGPVAETAWRLGVFATWLPAVAWINAHVAELTAVQGQSMYPYINEDKDSTLRNDVVLTWKWSPQDDLQRGMVVTLRSPNNPEAVAIKRIVGLEGDTVHTRPPYPFPKVKIPKGHIWVEGDGRPGTTIDSNTYGPVSRRLLVGRVTHILYPFHKFGEVKWWEHIPRPIERGPR
ncbi:hypothetical protein LMH87_010519 [Akanthomyces muscarius]|uniref:Mitochondrial inner membrane protease subunit 2 n=1 Tax=Akanthomyces muscarius TaxID=2231603 RepID=A0A9W8QDG8_AKAMU|nr:hypothetical protein LMH87_010519 [Akanthomyces muscarius]KAJ4154055.1 hypothetical protein LMH87_010519 [Akanthomyces muscarius]